MQSQELGFFDWLMFKPLLKERLFYYGVVAFKVNGLVVDFMRNIIFS